MNKRDAAIRDWVRKNRPDVSGTVDRILQLEGEDTTYQAIYAVMCMVFEAGREFQAKNPGLERYNSNVYL